MDPTADFFYRVVQERAGMLPTRLKTTLRFDLRHGVDGFDHWLVAVDEGKVRVSSEERPAEVVLRIDKELFDRLVTGEVKLLAAALRGEAMAEGNVVALSQFISALVPGPPGARDPREFVRERGARNG